MTLALSAQNIRDRLDQVLERLYQAGQRSGRNPDDVRVILVTKTHSLETIASVIEAGVRRLGENYADEAVPKIKAFQNIPGLEWHMIGHVQSRKAEMVCQHFDYMHSLDSLKIASRLNRFAMANNHRMPVLVECNTSDEPTKYGWNISEEDQWAGLVPELTEVANLPSLEIRGLMTVEPFLMNPQSTRPYFARLRRFRDFLLEQIPSVSWIELSMGMSNDFEIAVEEGATWVRIGQAVLGPRL